jgi:hypothetical protein
MSQNFESILVREHFIPENENLGWPSSCGIQNADTNGSISMMIKHAIYELGMVWVHYHNTGELQEGTS